MSRSVMRRIVSTMPIGPGYLACFERGEERWTLPIIGTALVEFLDTDGGQYSTVVADSEVGEQWRHRDIEYVVADDYRPRTLDDLREDIAGAELEGDDGFVGVTGPGLPDVWARRGQVDTAREAITAGISVVPAHAEDPHR